MCIHLYKLSAKKLKCEIPAMLRLVQVAEARNNLSKG